MELDTQKDGGKENITSIMLRRIKQNGESESHFTKI